MKDEKRQARQFLLINSLVRSENMTPDAAKAAVQRLKEDEPKKSRSTSNKITDYASFGGIHRKTKKK